ncbi:RNA polymerase sigma factor [Bacillaceae bacterium W0354]
MLKDSSTALDLMHDTFIRAFSNLESFKGGNERSWLLKIARNLTIDYLRRKRPVLLVNEKITVKSNENSPHQLAILNESEKELYHALDRLIPKYKEIIILRKIKEFSIKETSEILGWNESKVKNTLNRAMKKLKEKLVEEGYEQSQDNLDLVFQSLNKKITINEQDQLTVQNNLNQRLHEKKGHRHK